MILLLLGNFKIVFSQTIPESKGDLSCVYRAKFPPTQRNQFYPFAISETIKFVSFRYHPNNYPIKGDSLVTDSLVESKTLSKSDINSLTDILYNNFYKKKPIYGSIAQCYFPRNAILFFDKAGLLKDYIFICFHCDRHEESSERINFGDDCDQKVAKLRELFIKVGIKFGTDLQIEKYPGEGSTN